MLPRNLIFATFLHPPPPTSRTRISKSHVRLPWISRLSHTIYFLFWHSRISPSVVIVVAVWSPKGVWAELLDIWSPKKVLSKWLSPEGDDGLASPDFVLVKYNIPVDVKSPFRLMFIPRGRQGPPARTRGTPLNTRGSMRGCEVVYGIWISENFVGFFCSFSCFIIFCMGLLTILFEIKGLGTLSDPGIRYYLSHRAHLPSLLTLILNPGGKRDLPYLKASLTLPPPVRPKLLDSL